MNYSSDTDWGTRGYNGGLITFSLGSLNQIAGWTFTDKTLINGTATAGLQMNATSGDRYYRASLDSLNYVKMFYNSSSDWGVQGRSGGLYIFIRKY
jgi:hypothetical protein